jgi:hypothetical protein
MKLATLAANWIEAKPKTKAEAIAKARLLGAAEAASILGWGYTPTAVELAAIEYVRKDPRPKDFSAYQSMRKEWVSRVENEFAQVLVDQFSAPGFPYGASL